MNILWITNTIFPAPSKTMGLTTPNAGGWMYGMAMQIADKPDIHLAVATTYNGTVLKSFNIDGVVYYLLPSKNNTHYQKSLELIWMKICNEFAPDLIHIHGTEYTHGLACMRARQDAKYIISIQGLIGIISRFYYANISSSQIFKNITLRDLVRFDTIFQAKMNFERRSEFEKEYLLKTSNVIGRTNWDYAHTKAINPKVNYYFCNESLRDGFYTASKWDIARKTNFTIFSSQAYYPLKGIHQVLKAMAFLSGEFPTLMLRIAGPSIIYGKKMNDKIKTSGYGSYVKKLIKTLKLTENVQFIGTLTEDQMIEEYKNAHVFICPSSIENSPNSLGEAQLLGLPVIASFVGGIPDMVTHNISGLLYRFEDVEMMAENIRKIFNSNELAQFLSMNGIQVAEKRHNRQINLENTIRIYSEIINTK
ncbi:MAG: glycosyltransferase family 4 protein [Mariniphaga sp.]